MLRINFLSSKHRVNTEYKSSVKHSRNEGRKGQIILKNNYSSLEMLIHTDKAKDIREKWYWSKVVRFE